MNGQRPFSQGHWDGLPAAVQEYLCALEARVAALEVAVQHLLEQLRQDSRTSSRPPSSDSPQAIGRRPRREPSGRRPGGQPGHAGQTRMLVPMEEVDVVIPIKPVRCHRCRRLLHGEDAQPQRHQVTELPPAKPVVTEYQLHQLWCPVCGETTRAELPIWWHRVRDGTLAQASFARYMWPVRQEVEHLLEVGQTCGVPKTEGTCREILKRRQALWTFVRHAGVEPTNNAAERAIRPGVLWRKGSFGTQSAEGSRFVEVIMTVVAPLKPQQRNALDSVTAAGEAALRGEPAPSVRPTADDLNRLMHLAA